jgi:hypothetical protein
VRRENGVPEIKHVNNSRVVSKQLTQNDTNQSSSHNSPNLFQLSVPACLGRLVMVTSNLLVWSSTMPMFRLESLILAQDERWRRA